MIFAFMTCGMSHCLNSPRFAGRMCGFFETQFYRCMEAYGAKLGRRYCDLELRDYKECMNRKKQQMRADKVSRAMDKIGGQSMRLADSRATHASSTRGQIGSRVRRESPEIWRISTGLFRQLPQFLNRRSKDTLGSFDCPPVGTIVSYRF
jgi:hypothetical protein